MSALSVKDSLLLLKWSPVLFTQRFVNRINVQRPRAPHYERAKYLAFLKPEYKKDPFDDMPPSLKCRKSQELMKKNVRPDNPYEKILARELLNNFEKSKLIGFLHTNPILGEDEFQAKVRLKRLKMDIQVCSKYTAKLALEGTMYERCLQLLVTSNALVFCDEPKVAELIKTLKKTPQYILLAGVVDNRLLSVSQLETYVRLKNITLARAQFVATLNTAAQNLVSQLNQHQTTLVTRLDQIIEAKSSKEKSQS